MLNPRFTLYDVPPPPTLPGVWLVHLWRPMSDIARLIFSPIRGIWRALRGGEEDESDGKPIQGVYFAGMRLQVPPTLPPPSRLPTPSDSPL